MDDRIHILGIRHHGPGSARSVEVALKEISPDLILIEGPPEGDEMLGWVQHLAMKPPVALLVYPENAIEQASYYPFASFSPEWRAILFGLENEIPTRFFDLSPTSFWKEEPEDHRKIYSQDPLGDIASAAGYPDGETWWDARVEQATSEAAIFPGILSLMKEVRDSAPRPPEIETLRREATMRQHMRKALKDGYQRIAIVCGAYHGPALENLPPAKTDVALLKGMKKQKTRAIWVPWTYPRLSFQSGYGAGVISPEWYDLVFHTPKEDVPTYWMLKVAALLRKEDLDASPAQAIEAVRLSQALAALRGKEKPNLKELLEAIQTVFCFGSETPLLLVRKKLIIGDRMGSVPDTAPLLPLQIDIQRRSKKLRIPAQTERRSPMVLDLRKPFHLDKSHFLHRLNLLGVDWGIMLESESTTSTFKEFWDLDWQPELELRIIEAAGWGNTVKEACIQKVHDQVAGDVTLPEVTRILGQVFLAGLEDLLPFLISRMREMSSTHTDTHLLMEAFPPLVKILRYGNVRKTGQEEIELVLKSIFPRMVVGLPGAATNLNEERGASTFDRIWEVHQAIQLLPDPVFKSDWLSLLERLADYPMIFPKIAGFSTRMLFDYGKRKNEQTETSMSLALSRASDIQEAANWLEGFLFGSGQLLIHNPDLFAILDGWVSDLGEDNFERSLPLLRRAFSQFSPPERRRLGEMAKGDLPASRSSRLEWDEGRLKKALPVLGLILG